jgi:hypothetical protein
MFLNREPALRVRILLAVLHSSECLVEGVSNILHPSLSGSYCQMAPGKQPLHDTGTTDELCCMLLPYKHNRHTHDLEASEDGARHTAGLLGVAHRPEWYRPQNLTFRKLQIQLP